MRAPRPLTARPWLEVAVLAAGASFALSCASPTPPAQPHPDPKPAGAQPAKNDVPEEPLVAWPDEATDPVTLAPPPAPPLPADPDVVAKLVTKPSASAPGASKDYKWDGKKVIERVHTPPPSVSRPGPDVRGATPDTRRSRSLGSDAMSARGSMWGDEIGESFGAGGLGLSGVGEGGGGRGEGTGLGGVGTIGRGAGTGTGRGAGAAPTAGSSGPTGKPPAARSAGVGAPSGSHSAPLADRDAPALKKRDVPSSQESGVKAGEWDDNANFLDFRRYLAREIEGLPARRVDMSTRRFLVVRDADGKPVPNCEVKVEAAGRTVRMLTSSNGRAIVFPHAEGVVAPSVTARATCADAGSATATFAVDDVDGVVDLEVPGKRKLDATPTVDIAFILDTTGSMSEEIDAVKRTVQRVAQTVAARKLAVRFSLVEYKDRGDAFLVRVHPMTRDVAGFVTRIRKVTADGGGDRPEDVIEGLRAGLTRVEWSKSSAVRLAFLIGDAPPQLGYGNGSYVDAMRAANRAGIVLHTIAASGMDDLGQMVWRQVAQYTGGTNLFVLRGGAGPQSTGAGDAKSSCGTTHDDFTSGNLDALITTKVERAVAALQADPMRIAGLGRDELSKPCAQRIASQ